MLPRPRPISANTLCRLSDSDRRDRRSRVLRPQTKVYEAILGSRVQGSVASTPIRSWCRATGWSARIAAQCDPAICAARAFVLVTVYSAWRRGAHPKLYCPGSCLDRRGYFCEDPAVHNCAQRACSMLVDITRHNRSCSSARLRALGRCWARGQRVSQRREAARVNGRAARTPRRSRSTPASVAGTVLSFIIIAGRDARRARRARVRRLRSALSRCACAIPSILF